MTRAVQELDEGEQHTGTGSRANRERATVNCRTAGLTGPKDRPVRGSQATKFQSMRTMPKRIMLRVMDCWTKEKMVPVVVRAISVKMKTRICVCS